MAPNYEETRKQRMEENKKRMEELGLMHLSNSLVKPKVVRARKKQLTLEDQGLQRRRSIRVAAYQAKEELLRAKDEEEESELEKSGDSESDPDSEPESLVVRTRYSLRRSRKSPPREATSDGQVEANEAAEDIEKDLENPGFVVSLQDVHISTDFLDVPENFRKRNFPTSDEKVALEDGEGKEWETTFLTNSGVLGDGWSKFAQDHKLEAGDACVFELLSSNKMKVHLVRASEQTAAIAKNLTGKRVKRETSKAVSGNEVIDLDGNSGVENNGERSEGSEDDWNPDSSSEEEAPEEEEEEEEDDDNWRP